MYIQRYLVHFPAAGEIVIWDRSWYNRLGVEHVMGFATKEQYEGALANVPIVEGYITAAGIILIKYWLEVSNEEQERRFEARVEDPLRQWKLSPIDLPSRERWYDYSRARDRMLEATDTKHAPWHLVRSDNKKRARLNCISHLLSLIPYKKLPREKIKIPKRSNKGKYDDQATLKGRRFIPEVY
jgi:polyphosphate kinase 2 (PPK2 family)